MLSNKFELKGERIHTTGIKRRETTLQRDDA